MIENFFKIAYRNLLRNKGFPTINTSGLSIEMPSAKLILLWVQNEVSYDRFHANGNRLYEIFGNNCVGDEIRIGTATLEIMAPELKNDVPEKKQVYSISGGEDYLFSIGDKSLKASGNLVDPSFLRRLKPPLLTPVKSLRTE